MPVLLTENYFGRRLTGAAGAELLKAANDGGHFRWIAKEDMNMNTKILVAVIVFGLGVVSAYAAPETQQLSCTGQLIDAGAVPGKPSTLKLSLGPKKDVALDLGEGSIKARMTSDNDIQLKFKTKDFIGEYFHYTGDLFLIYKSGKLMHVICQK